MHKAVLFDKEKCSCNSCLTRGCGFINAKWSINQAGVALRFFSSSVINLVPVLMKNEGERLGDSENVYIIQKVIMACNGAVDLPAWELRGERRMRPGCTARSARGKQASKSATAHSPHPGAFCISVSFKEELPPPRPE